jgi:acetyl-CoA synthetase
VRAVVVRAQGAPAPEELTDQLRAIVRERVGRHAYPRIVDYVDALPRTETGKLRRSALR